MSRKLKPEEQEMRGAVAQMARASKGRRRPIDPPSDTNETLDRLADSLRERLRDSMEHRGMSQSDLARASSISVSTINRILSGERRFNTDQLSKICKALGLSPESIFISAGTVAAVEVGRPTRSPETVDVENRPPVSDSLRLFLDEHRDRITPAERRLLVEEDQLFSGVYDVNLDFWRAHILMLRQMKQGKI